LNNVEWRRTVCRWLVRLPGLAATNRSTWEPLLRGAAAVLGISSIAQLLSLGLQILFARLLGPPEFGVFSFVLASLSLCLILAKLGLDTSLIRLVAEFTAQGDAGRVLGLVRFARVTGSVLAILVAVVVVVTAAKTSAAESPSLLHALVVGGFLLPFAVASELTAATLRGLRRVAIALVGDGWVRPCVAGTGILVVAALWPDSLTGSSAVFVYLAGTVASLVVMSVVLQHALPKGTAKVDIKDIERYLRVSVPLMIASGLLLAMYSLDTVMLGVLVDTTAAGYYSVASRIATVLLFVKQAAQTVASPMLAAAWASGKLVSLRGVVRTLNGLSILAAVPGSILLLVAAEPILALFGSEFREAAPALRILVLAQLLNVLTGPTGIVLSMTGHGQSLAGLLFMGLALNAILNLMWIPAYGLIGAAAAAFVAQAAWNVAGAFLIRTRLSIDITLFDFLRRSDVRRP